MTSKALQHSRDIEAVLLEPDLQIILALCDVVDWRLGDLDRKSNPDQVAHVLVKYMAHHQYMSQLAQLLIRREVSRTVDQATLFRRNSLASKVLSAYSKLIGENYLATTFTEVINSICDLDVAQYEVDSNKLQASSEQLLDNATRLIVLSKKFLEVILDSAPNCPYGMRNVCFHLFAEVGTKFPQLRSTAIGGFVFLRFFCPAIIAPERFNLLRKPITGKQRRILVLVSKILQNISNGILSSSKECYMETMNQFVSVSVARVNKFFEALAQPCDRLPPSPITEFEHEIVLSDLIYLLKIHVHKIGRALIAGAGSDYTETPAELLKSDKRGILYKRQDNFFKGSAKGWQKRWFLLRNHQLLYYRSTQDTTPAGAIPLADTSISIKNAAEATFDLITSYRTFFLKAPSQQDMRGWIEAIKKSCETSESDANTSSSDEDEVGDVAVQEDIHSKLETSVNDRGLTSSDGILQRTHATTSASASASDGWVKSTSKKSIRRSTVLAPVVPNRKTKLSIGGSSRSSDGSNRNPVEKQQQRHHRRSCSAGSMQEIVPKKKAGLTDSGWQRANAKDNAVDIIHKGLMEQLVGKDWRCFFLQLFADKTMRKSDMERRNEILETFNLDKGSLFITNNGNNIQLQLANKQEIQFRGFTKTETKEWVLAFQKLLGNTAKQQTTKSKIVLFQSAPHIWTKSTLMLVDNTMAVTPLNISRSPFVISVGNSFVRVGPEPNTFVVIDGSAERLFKVDDPKDVKTWMTDIKKAKLAYWKTHKAPALKQMSSSDVARNSGSRPSSANRKRMSTVGATDIELARRWAKCKCRGYLMKGTQRYWFELTDTQLLTYKHEKVAAPYEIVELSHALIQQHADLEFSVTTADTKQVLSANNINDLYIWVTALNDVAMRDVQKEDNAKMFGSLILKREFQVDNSYWFKIDSTKLCYYDTKSMSKLIGAISLHEVNVTEGISPLEIFLKSTRTDDDSSIVLIASSESSRNEWKQRLQDAKIQALLQAPPENTVNFNNRGYLMKRGNNIKNWCRRWFVLKGSFLLYFKTHLDATPLGEIGLEKAYIRKSEAKESSLRFEVELEHRTYLLEAANENEVKIWMQTLKQAKLQYWKENKTGLTLQQQPSIEDFAASMQNPDKEGFLYKQGVTVKNWKRRWFVLKGTSLYYFNSPQITQGEKAGMIPLRDAKIVESQRSRSKDKEFSFQLVTRFRIYFLQAESADDLKQWWNTIEKAISGKTTACATSDSPSPSAPTKVGYLIKKGASNNIWRKRWFVLQANLLSYYKTEHESRPLGVIALENCSVDIAEDEVSKRRPFCFVLSTRYRNYFVQANDQYEMAGWIENINCCSNAKLDGDSGKVAKVKLFNQLNAVLASHDKSLAS